MTHHQVRQTPQPAGPYPSPFLLAPEQVQICEVPHSCLKLALLWRGKGGRRQKQRPGGTGAMLISCAGEQSHAPAQPYSSCRVLHHPGVNAQCVQTALCKPWGGFPQSHFVSMEEEELPHLQRPKAAQAGARAELSSHGRAFYLTSTSVKLAVANLSEHHHEVKLNVSEVERQNHRIFTSTVTNSQLLPLRFSRC